jgi:hypothetical protein
MDIMGNGKNWCEKRLFARLTTVRTRQTRGNIVEKDRVLLWRFCDHSPSAGSQSYEEG